MGGIFGIFVCLLETGVGDDGAEAGVGGEYGGDTGDDDDEYDEHDGE